MAISHRERLELAYQAREDRRRQLQAVFSAVLKLEMMNKNLENGLVECPPPDFIHPFRWKAMLSHAIRNMDYLSRDFTPAWNN